MSTIFEQHSKQEKNDQIDSDIDGVPNGSEFPLPGITRVGSSTEGLAGVTT